MDVDLPYKPQWNTGHEDRAWHVAWNPAKPLLASCSADKTVRLYSYASSSNEATPGLEFQLITSIPTGHAKTVRSVAWAPAGQTLATASFDSNIGIWEKEADEWECISTLEGHETECKCIAYSASGTLLASCSRDKTVWIWEVHPDGDFETISVLMEHTQDVKFVSWHPIEEILASASYDDTIKLYIEDPSDDWYCFSTLSGHTSTVWSLAWSPGTSSYLASSSDDKTVRVWRRVAEHKWECVLVLGGHDRSVYSVSWNKAPKSVRKSTPGCLGWLASAGGDGKVLIWELSEPILEDNTSGNVSLLPPRHKLIASIPSAHGVHDVNSVVWCPREGYEDLLATTGDDGYTRVWKIVPTT
ncbi:putative cytosolic iron-sulfur protein assembly protein 1 [Psilocybe cubensis]|uniref:Cytosolic iron-sulfur protein assembly protein 1 n=2 Tax=Psilocybe cubensis TaxID=181762 RepID=A0ACB8GRS5_PSICU|nr:putative cytosolic iron-sulfur protein assembly protein 1 [Psilocybe cubensis]KAH9477739.1 putative cytosolic iron-sulfur protein assembly protein 1 [Psilocybe cubensis]